MTDNDTPHGQHSPDGEQAQGETRLRWQLRGMREDLPPERDLWPLIAARITSAGGASTNAAAPRRRKITRWAPLALAASLLLAVGLAWQWRALPADQLPAAGETAQSSAHPESAKLLHIEAEAMALQYGAALQELQAASPQTQRSPAEIAALETLDRSTDQIRDALRRDPNARFLFERLRRTYALRLALTQRTTFT